MVSKDIENLSDFALNKNDQTGIVTTLPLEGGKAAAINLFNTLNDTESIKDYVGSTITVKDFVLKPDTWTTKQGDVVTGNVVYFVTDEGAVVASGSSVLTRQFMDFVNMMVNFHVNPLPQKFAVRSAESDNGRMFTITPVDD